MPSVLNVAYPLAPVGPDAVGGAEVVVAAIDAALVAAGRRSLVLACEGSRAAGAMFTSPLPRAPMTERSVAAAHRRYRAAIARILATERVDLVHFHGVDFSAYLPDCATPVLATLHLPPAWYPRSVFAAARPRTYLNCVSRSQLATCPPSRAPMLGAIANGVDLARFRPGRRDDAAVVLGRVCAEKGVHRALQAARRAGVPLIVAGHVYPYPDHQRYFRDEVQPLLGPEHRFVGPVTGTDKPALLAAARCLIVPSTAEETSSLAALEALACGTPVIAFRRGALPELIDHGRTGFLVDDVDGLAEALAAAPAVDASACRAAAERFPVQATCARYMELYDDLARRPTTQRAAPIAIDELTEVDELRALAPEWDALWARCPEATVFQRPDWLVPWCEHVMRGNPRALAIHRGGSLIGLAPLFEWRDGERRVLSLMGAGVSDYLDALVAPDERGPVAERIERWLGARRDGSGLPSGLLSGLLWSELPAHSPLLAVAAPSATTVRAQDVCPGLPLPRGATLDRTVPARMMARLAYARRRAARDLGVSIEDARAAGCDSLFGCLETLHGARRRERGDPGALAGDRVRAFHRAVARKLASRGELVLLCVRLGADPAAALYGFHDRAATRYYLGGFDPRFARYSPGTLAIGCAIERALDHGSALFDFLRGAEPYKYAWGARDRVTLYRRETTPAGPCD